MCLFRFMFQTPVFNISNVTSIQRPGTEAVRTQIQPSKLKRKITKITISQNKKSTNGQSSEQLFPKGGFGGLAIQTVNWSPVITHQQCDNRQRLMYRWFSLAHLKNR